MAEKVVKDFLTIVEDHLEKEHVYHPVDEFVKNISLCPSMMGPRNADKLLATLLRMVNLAKKKREAAKNKKRYNHWLKQAARSIMTYQLANRDWVNSNVSKLPDLPKPEEQVYDPNRGRRDIRYYPSSVQESKTGEGEGDDDDALDLDLDLNEEELLASPPSQSTKEPAGNTPQPMEVDEPVDTSSKPVSSPRKSPRLAEKAKASATAAKPTISPIKAPPRHEPQKTTSPGASKQKKGKEDQKRASSSPSEHPSGRHDSKRHQSETSRKAKENKKEHKRANSRKNDKASSSSHTDARYSHPAAAKNSESKNSSAASSSRKEGHEGKSSASQRLRTVERQVTIGRGMTIEYPPTTVGKNKRPSTASLEPLVISTTVLKKKKTDEILHQVREKVEERRRSEGSGRDRRCWVPGCQERNTYIKAHAFRHHVPGIFDERLKPDNEQVLRGRRNALNQATRWLLGRPAPLEELVNFVVIQRMLSSTDNTEVTPRQQAAMREMCRFLRTSIPDQFILDPANSIGCRIHWKAILLIAASLDEEERKYWKAQFPIPETAELQAEQPEVIYPNAFDSHFHLDRTLRQLNLNPAGNLDDIKNCVLVDDDKKVSLIGTVAVYCDPTTYPSEQRLLDLPEDMIVAVGLHPKHARNSVRTTEGDINQLSRLLKNPRVRALGEIGLDHSEPMRFWSYQVELLEKVLPLLEDRHVLVIHCRGMKDDCGTEAYLLLLHFLKKKVHPNHPIHLHCFTGNQYVVQRWLETFPRTYFGFTNMTERFNPGQIAALRSIDENRLLLESDAPYFPSINSRTSSPHQIYFAANCLAKHRQITVERVLEVTMVNAGYLYRGQFQ